MAEPTVGVKNFGALGTGRPSIAHVNRSVRTGLGVSSVCTGRSHACALKHRVKFGAGAEILTELWGTVPTMIPGAGFVSGMPSGQTITSLSCGQNSSMILLGNGEIWGWVWTLGTV